MGIINRRQAAPSPDQARGIKDWISWTLGVKDVQFDRLSEDDQAALFRLAQRAGTQHGADFSRLGKDRPRFETLVAEAAGLPGDAFERARQDAIVLREFAQLAAEGRRRETLSLQAETDFFRAMARHLRSGHLWTSHVSLLTLLLAEFSSGEPLGPRQHFEGTGDDLTLAVDSRFGLFGTDVDPDSRTADWRFLLGHLEKTKWLVVKRAGPEWRISFGPSMLRALRRTGTRPGVPRASSAAKPRPEAEAA